MLPFPPARYNSIVLQHCNKFLLQSQCHDGNKCHDGTMSSWEKVILRKCQLEWNTPKITKKLQPFKLTSMIRALVIFSLLESREASTEVDGRSCNSVKDAALCVDLCYEEYINCVEECAGHCCKHTKNCEFSILTNIRV